MKKIMALLCGVALLTSGAAVAGNAAAGKEKAKVCAACHGADGNSPIADNPKLAGQQADYIVKSLQAYKSGTRKNPVMAPMGSSTGSDNRFFSSIRSRSAVFFPTPGTRLNSSASSAKTARWTASRVIVESTDNATFGPTPSTPSRIWKSSRSACISNP